MNKPVTCNVVTVVIAVFMLMKETTLMVNADSTSVRNKTIGEVCTKGIECINARCDLAGLSTTDESLSNVAVGNGTCSNEISTAIVTTGSLVMAVTLALYVLCCFNDAIRSFFATRRIKQRLAKKMRAKSIDANDIPLIPLNDGLVAVETAKSLKQRAVLVLRKSRRIMDHPGKQMTNIEIEEYRDVRDFDIWAIRIAACGLIEETHHNVTPEGLEKNQSETVKLVTEMESIVSLMIKAFISQGRGEDDAGDKFRHIKQSVSTVIQKLPPMMLNKKAVEEIQANFQHTLNVVPVRRSTAQNQQKKNTPLNPSSPHEEGHPTPITNTATIEIKPILDSAVGNVSFQMDTIDPSQFAESDTAVSISLSPPQDTHRNSTTTRNRVPSSSTEVVPIKTIEIPAETPVKHEPAPKPVQSPVLKGERKKMIEAFSKRQLSKYVEGKTGEVGKDEAMLFNLSDVLKLDHNDSLWGFKGPMFKAMESRSRGLLERFATTDEAKRAVVKARISASSWIRRFKTHPHFFATLFIIYTSVFLAFVAKTNRTNAGLRKSDVIVVNDNPFFTGEEAKNPPGGFGTTFLPVPPQYNLDEDLLQAIAVPFIYGLMHCALTTICLLPICFWRGIWRDLVHTWPGIRRYIPVDDFEWLHRQLGILALTFIMLGGVLWMVIMGYFRCLPGGTAVNLQACRAFDPGNGVNVFSPIDNVVMLRVLVWATWFTLIPLMKIGKDAPIMCCPRFIKKYWYEFCYYIHIFVSLVTLTLALIARFQVFHPILITWCIYLIDWFREATLHTKRMYFSPEESVWHSSSVDGKPTTMQLRFRPEEDYEDKPKSCCTLFRKRVPVKAGMWVYIKVPEIDSVWHPFSITNKTSDKFLELDMGIRGVLQPVGEDIEADFPWYMKNSSATWTYKMWERMRNTMNDHDQDHAHFPVDVRGPYGAAFISCFDKTHAGSVVIGAGTGVTAAQSVLKEFLWRKSQSISVPPFCFFVWSCQRVDDLLWVFPGLRLEIVEAVRNGVLDVKAITPGSSMLDWISVTCYVSKAEKEAIKTFHQYLENETKKAKSEEDVLVLLWLAEQVVWSASMDDKGSHIARYLYGVREKLRDAEHGDKLSICYCGPTALALVIGAAAETLTPLYGKHSIEFTTDAQG